ncbi:trans-acting factor B [Sinorhizobium meliloti]|nr:trans-acting factor B [Sinorhizobium meliloti]MDW9515395.1 trans-acting factor B [Sinorhizobium meliloti]MDX0378238.1 trans-acting factor B [Sinorhizobium meliloti]
MKALVTFCRKTGRRRLRLYLNRQVAKLSHKGQLKISVAVSLPLIAKVEVGYQCDFNAKADNDNKPK